MSAFRSRAAAFAVVMLAACSPTLAGVVLDVGSQGRLDVRLTHGPIGVWSPTGPIGPGVLNPDGDLLGDGVPVVASSSVDHEVLVAWVRGPLGTVHAAVGRPSGWAPVRLPPATGAVGAPVLVPGQEGILVAWQEGDRLTGPAVAVAWPPVAGNSTPTEAVRFRGRLLAAGVVDGRFWLALEESWGESGELVVHVGPETPGEPIEWSRVGLTGSRINDGPIVLSVHELGRPRGASTPALAWWTGDRTVSATALDASLLQGAPRVVTVEANKSHAKPASLIKEVLRLLR